MKIMNKKIKILMTIHLRHKEINIVKIIVRLCSEISLTKYAMIGSDRNRCNHQNNDNGEVKKLEKYLSSINTRRK